MWNILYTEMLKMKRASMIKAGIIIIGLSCVFSSIPLFAADTTAKDFTLLMRNILESNCIYFSPVLTTLLGSYMMEREISDNTLKNILLIPLSFQKILFGKLIVLLFMVILFGAGNSLLGGLLGIILKLPGINIMNFCLWSIRLIFANILIFVAVLPITIIAACKEGAMLAGTAVSFVYGFIATIDWKPMNYYPITAAMIITNPIYSEDYEWLHYSKNIAGIVIVIVFLISLILITRMHPLESKRKSLKVARKKGW